MTKQTTTLCVIAALLLSALPARPDDAARVKELVAAVKGGPRTYYTTAALEEVARKAGTSAQMPNPEFTDHALRSLKAACDLGDMGSRAWDGIEALVEMYPTAVHTVTVSEMYYAEQGTFDDWVMTRVMGERSKFAVNPPVLGYDQLSKCDQYLEATQEASRSGDVYGARGVLQSANAVIRITFTFYAGACALARITGREFGTSEEGWRNWWLQNRAAVAPAPSAAPTPATPFATAAQVSPRDIMVGGSYRFTLTTGDAFTGVVDSRTDTSLVVDAEGGKGYTFRMAIVRECQLVSLPARLAMPAGQSGPAGESQTLSFDAVTVQPPFGKTLQVRIQSGQTFQGAFNGVDGDNLKLSVQGSVIPINRNIIVQIATVPAQRPAPQPQTAPQPAGPPPDTIVVINPKTDDWGRRQPSFVYVGSITQDLADRVVFKRQDGATVEVKHSDIERMVKHSADTDDGPIKRYARPLRCPDDMVLVDVPPGKESRPFFKVCIDKYEGPNQLSATPQGNVSFADAQRYCGGKGKRVCTAAEWQWACSGLEGYAYAYGNTFDEQACNTAGVKMLSSSGARSRCVSRFGASDMTGNVFEWVSAANKPMLMGGPSSKCQSVSPGGDGSAQPYTGYRCCKSN